MTTSEPARFEVGAEIIAGSFDTLVDIVRALPVIVPYALGDEPEEPRRRRLLREIRLRRSHRPGRHSSRRC